MVHFFAEHAISLQNVRIGLKTTDHDGGLLLIKSYINKLKITKKKRKGRFSFPSKLCFKIDTAVGYAIFKFSVSLNAVTSLLKN